eukprot:scaffold118360_cov19-Tisochrysis_lutea.AAC.1
MYMEGPAARKWPLSLKVTPSTLNPEDQQPLYMFVHILMCSGCWSFGGAYEGGQPGAVVCASATEDLGRRRDSTLCKPNKRLLRHYAAAVCKSFDPLTALLLVNAVFTACMHRRVMLFGHDCKHLCKWQ